MATYGTHTTFRNIKTIQSGRSIFFILFVLSVCLCTGYGPQEIYLAAFTNPQLNSALFFATEHRGIFCH